MFSLFNRVFSQDNNQLTNQDSLKKEQSKVTEYHLDLGIVKNFKIETGLKRPSPIFVNSLVKIIREQFQRIPFIRISSKNKMMQLVSFAESSLKISSEKNNDFLKKWSNLKQKIIRNYSNTNEKQVLDDLKAIYKEKKIEVSHLESYWEFLNQDRIGLKIIEISRYIKSPFAEISDPNELGSNVPDFLLMGELKKIENLVYMTIYIYDSFSGNKLNTWYLVNEENEIETNLEKNIYQWSLEFSKLPYSRLKIITKPNDAKIFLDEKYLGKGEVTNEYLLSGEYSLSALSKGRKKVEKKIQIGLFEEREEILELIQEQELIDLKVNTIPQGAKLYLNSRFISTSPLQTQIDPGIYILSVQMDDYRMVRYEFDTNSEKFNNVMNFELKREVLMGKEVSLDLEFEKKRRFYLSFWIFNINLTLNIAAATINYEVYIRRSSLSSLLSRHESQLRNHENPDSSDYKESLKEYRKLYEITYGFNVAFYVLLPFSIAFSIASPILGVWMFYSLFDYLFSLGKDKITPLTSINVFPSHVSVNAGLQFSLPF